MKRILLWILIVVGAGAFPASAWNDTGHKLVAAIAYQQLTANERLAVDALLKGHTNYHDWVGEFSRMHTTVALEPVVFMLASTWPDDIRENDDQSTHPHWHYVDYPLLPPLFPKKAAPLPRDNVIYGINRSVDYLEEIHANRGKQAEYLCWLIHLCGDVHQPLHCSSLFNATFHGSEGDRGGNSFKVKMKETSANPTKLHGLWDGLLGSGADPDNLVQKAKDIAQAHPRGSYPTLTAPPSDWAKEGWALARTQAYEPLPSLDGTTAHPVVLPANYFANARGVAESQAALAGHRLADQIRAILAARGVTP